MNISVVCATSSIVNITLLSIELNCQKKSQICLKLISNDKNYSKFNISPTLGLKSTKSTPRNTNKLPILCIATCEERGEFLSIILMNGT